MDAWEQSRLPDDLSYEDWISFTFDHPVLRKQWWFQSPESGLFQYWSEDADPTRTLSYLTKFFTTPAILLSRFSRAQIDQGLNYIVNNSCSDHMFVLTNESIPWTERRACLAAIFNLFRDLMAPVYGNDLSAGRTSRENDDRPTFSCYMWWDVIPIRVRPLESSLIVDEILDVLEKILTLDAEACLESGMHGVSEFHFADSKRFEQVGRNFLKRQDISPALRTYAKAAALGLVQ